MSRPTDVAATFAAMIFGALAIVVAAVALVIMICSCAPAQPVDPEQAQRVAEQAACRGARAAAIITCAREPEGKSCADARIAEQAACVTVCPQEQIEEQP